MLHIISLVYIFFTIILESFEMQCPIVETQLGKYRGHYITTLNGREVAAFNGIRYAKPPINQLRFKEPQKIEAHEGIYDATKDGDDCLQFNNNYSKYSLEEMAEKKYLGSEDCLFLNVYTPNFKPEKKYPVMIHIHGGSFTTGTSSSTWHGPHLLLDKDVILVAINYRLGILGFLAMDDEVLPGNLGLKDQSLAINWVRDNIESFGGNKDMITVMGHSAGAASAQFQMLSPRNKGIIKRAIIQSGSIECPFGLMPKNEAKDIALQLTTILNCPKSPTAFLACLQEKTSERLMNAVEELEKIRPEFDFLFLPVFETNNNGFITEEDYNRGSTIPLMTGVTKDDGAIFYRELYKLGYGSLKHVNNEYKKIFPSVFQYIGNPKSDEISEKIKKRYFDDEDITDKVDQLIKMVTDGLFVYGTIQTAKLHKGDSYLYILTHLGEKSLTNNTPIRRICHGDELYYLFPFSKTETKLQFNEDDTKVQKLFVELWTNFAIYGNPTPDKTTIKWNTSNNGKNYVKINTEGLQADTDLFSSRMIFWEDIFTNYIQNKNYKEEL